MRYNLALVGLLLFSVAEAQQLPVPEQAVATDLKIANTPQVQAVCLSGAGDNIAYARASTRLFGFLTGADVNITSLFSTRWDPGQDPNGKEAAWDVCGEVSVAPAGLAAPFEFRTIAPQEAVHGLCATNAKDLRECFSALERFGKEKDRVPAAPARYKMIGEDASSKTSTYEMWLPLRPLPQPMPPPANTPPPPEVT